MNEPRNRQDAILSVSDLSAGYARHPVVSEVSFDLTPGQCLGIVGANGAGKSTLLQAIGGQLQPYNGTVRYADDEITYLSPWLRSRRGLAFVPESRELFTGMSVIDHLRAGVHRMNRARARERIEFVLDLFPILADLLGRTASSLSGGQQQTLAIARAVVVQPRVLLLDEPSLGLSPIAVQTVIESLARLRALSEIGVVIAEQSLTVVRQICDQIIVLNLGQPTHQGPADEVLTTAVLQSTFL